MNAWFLLFFAGIFEIGFTTFMKLSEGFTKWVYISLFLVSVVLSFSFLAEAMKTIPIGTAYAVWSGIGALGTAVVGMVFFKDPVSLARIFFLALLVISILGLKLVSR